MVKSKTKDGLKRRKRGWSNPAKKLPKTTEKQCTICHKKVKNYEAHMRSKHREK